MFDKKIHYENKNLVDVEANQYLDTFKSALSYIHYLRDREYQITQAKFFSLKKIDDSNYYSREFEEFVDLIFVVENEYKYRASLGRKYNSQSWQFIPNTASPI